MISSRLVLTAGLVCLVLAGCANATQPTSSSTVAESVAAQEGAEVLANPENGVVAESDEVTALVTGVSSDSGSSTVILTANGALSDWTWNSSTGRYEKTGSSLTVQTSGYSGQISYSAWISFYTSTDASGTSTALGDSTASLTDSANQSIHSLKYGRTYTGTVYSSARALNRTITATSAYTATGINDATAGYVLSGTRTDTVTANSARLQGTWTDSQTLQNWNVQRTVSGSSVTTVRTGTVVLGFDGSWTSTYGTSSLNVSAQATLNGTSTCVVTLGGRSVTVDLETGETS